MTYRIPRSQQITAVYDSVEFLNYLRSAQEGSPIARDLVVMATMPLIFQLTSDEDEVSELVVCVYERVIPQWTEARLYCPHAQRHLRWRLLDLRKFDKRRRERGF